MVGILFLLKRPFARCCLNAITDALENLEQQNYGLAAECLKEAQVNGENAYLTAEDTMTILE